MEKRLSIDDFVDKYNKKKGQIKGGTLCFYGHWFGRPYDNYHQLESVTFDKQANILTLAFDEKETLEIYNPQDISEFDNHLAIDLADRIKWQWFYYGKPQTTENLYFIEVVKHGEILIGNSNVNWYKPDFKDLNMSDPALLWI